jgi:hypothetical protein
LTGFLVPGAAVAFVIKCVLPVPSFAARGLTSLVTKGTKKELCKQGGLNLGVFERDNGGFDKTFVIAAMERSL